MASTEKLIRITLQLNDKMSKELKKSSSGLDKFAGKMTKVGIGMSAALTAPIAGLAVGIFKTFAEYENVMAELQARTGATESDMKSFAKVAKQMGRDTVFSATEAGQAMLELASSGFDATEAIAALPAVLDLAAAGALDLGKAADGVTDILNAFQREASDSAMVADVLARAAGSSSASVADLLEGFGNVGPAAKAMGLSVNETAAVLALFAENSVKGAEDGTQLRSMLTNMTRTTDKVKDAWQELGTSMFDAQGMARPLDDVFKDIAVSMASMSMEDQNRIAQDLAGSFGKLGFQTLVASNGLSGMQDKMVNAASASEVAQARMNTLSGKVTSMKGSFETLAIVLGDLGDGPLKDFIDMVTKGVNAVTAWAEENPKLAQTIMLIVGAIALLGPVLIFFGMVAGAISSIIALGPAIVGVWAAVSVAISSIIALAPAMAGAWAVILGPIGLIAVAVGIAIAALWLLANNWREIVTTLWMAFQLLPIALEATGAAISAVMKWLANLMLLPLRVIWLSIQAFIQQLQFSGSLTLAIGSAFSAGFKAIAEAFGIPKEAIWKAQVAISKFFTWLDSGAALKSIKNFGAALVSGFVVIVKSIIGAFQQLPSALMSIGSAIMQGLINGVKSMITTFVNIIKGMVNGVVSTVRNGFQIRSPSKVMAKLGEQVGAGFNVGLENMGGFGVNVPQINGANASSPSLAVGGAGASGGAGNIFIEKAVFELPQGTSDDMIKDISRKLGKLAKKRGAQAIK